MRLVVLACLLFAPAVLAQTEQATESAARMLAEDGQRAIEAHDWAGALAKYEQAEAVSPSPAVSLRAAECLEKLGRLVEAADRLERTAKLAPDPAAAEARARRDAILPRIAHLRLDVTRRPDTIVLDGKNVSAFEGAIAVDPGVHRVTVRSRTDEARGEITLGEGEERTLRLALPIVATSAPAPIEPPKKKGSPMRIVGLVVLGVGAAVAVSGLVMLAASASQANSLDAACPNHTCPSSEAGRVASYDSLRTASFVTLAVGAVMAGAGGTLFVAF